MSDSKKSNNWGAGSGEAPSPGAPRRTIRDLAEERLYNALSVILHGLRDSDDPEQEMRTVAEVALGEWKTLRAIPAGPRTWYCCNCSTWKPGTEARGDLICACGHVIASYRDEAERSDAPEARPAPEGPQ